jgi:hypothetical protein
MCQVPNGEYIDALHDLLLPTIRASALMAILPPNPPYSDSLEVPFTSVATLARGKMLDTAIVDFCVG